jgi:glutamate dehydrogenase (NADP+)
MLVEEKRSGGATAPRGFVDEFMARVRERNEYEPEFLQAVHEVVQSVVPVLERQPGLRTAKILERMVEPERSIQFRVPWTDDFGEIQVSRGFRVQFNSALGPYKGGLRFHPSVNLSIMKFLGFEQIFKNALTTLPIGGAKGGSDFDPKGRSDAEVMRFCQSFMTELFRHVGPDTDVPAGDIGVGGREIGFMYGQYKRIVNEFTGVFTGKGYDWGGSHIRPEATGFGAVYFAAAMLEAKGQTIAGKRCLVSGSGNVAQYTCEKLIDLGAKPVTLSDSGGFIHDPAGIDRAKLAWVMELKNVRRGRIHDYADRFKGTTFTAADPARDHNPLWMVHADAAFPCATQNEINEVDARNLVSGGVTIVTEGSNMPTTPEAVEYLLEKRVMVGPAKAANAGGVSVSALEMSQNSLRMHWSREEVDARLREIMRSIHRQAADAAQTYGCPGNYVVGANIAAFIKVAGAMLDQGLV